MVACGGVGEILTARSAAGGESVGVVSGILFGLLLISTCALEVARRVVIWRTDSTISFCWAFVAFLSLLSRGEGCFLLLLLREAATCCP